MTAEHRLAEPSPELAAKILRELPYEECLSGLQMAAMGGSSRHLLSSFEKVANFMSAEATEYSWSPADEVPVGYVSLDVLQRWVREVFGDEELADLIKAEAATDENYVRQVAVLKPLMQERLEVCREVVARVDTDGGQTRLEGRA